MTHDKRPSEEEIRTRSYLIWEREGRPDGKSEEHWLRAKAELEEEFEVKWREASLVGESTRFVLPVLPISTPPSRSVANKIRSDTEQTKAVA